MGVRRLAGLDAVVDELEDVALEEPEDDLEELEPELDELEPVVVAELPEEPEAEDPPLLVWVTDSEADELTQEVSEPEEIVTGEVNAVAPVPSLTPRVLTEKGKPTKPQHKSESQTYTEVPAAMSTSQVMEVASVCENVLSWLRNHNLSAHVETAAGRSVDY